MHETERDWIADVLRQWDCFEQEWVPGAPVLVRFERADALISEAMIATESGSSKARSISERSENACLCWRIDPSLSHLVGRRMTPQAVQRLLSKGS